MSETTSNINVTPLIDILLVLLVIFMVISPMKSSDFKTKIPREPTNEPNVKANIDNLVVTINSNSSLILNKDEKLGTIEEPTALIARLSDIFKQRDKNLNNEKTVFIKAPKTMNYGDIVKVVDAVKMSGASPLSLQIDDLEKYSSLKNKEFIHEGTRSFHEVKTKCNRFLTSCFLRVTSWIMISV